MRLHDISEQAIAAARPDLVILAEDGFEALATPAQVCLKDLQDKGKVISATVLLQAPVPLEVLANIVGVSLEPYRKGEA